MTDRRDGMPISERTECWQEECAKCGGLSESYARRGRCVNEACDGRMVAVRYVRAAAPRGAVDPGALGAAREAFKQARQELEYFGASEDFTRSPLEAAISAYLSYPKGAVEVTDAARAHMEWCFDEWEKLTSAEAQRYDGWIGEFILESFAALRGAVSRAADENQLRSRGDDHTGISRSGGRKGEHQDRLTGSTKHEEDD